MKNEVKYPDRLAEFLERDDVKSIDNEYGYGYRHGYILGHILVRMKWQIWSHETLSTGKKIEPPQSDEYSESESAQIQEILWDRKFVLMADSFLRRVLFETARLLGFGKAKRDYEQAHVAGMRDGIEETHELCVKWHKSKIRNQGEWNSDERPF